MTEYVVIGAGAIGGTLAHHLASRGHVVSVVDSNAEHVAAMREHGLALVHASRGSESIARFNGVMLPDEVDKVDPSARVILATKSHQVPAAAEWLARNLTGDNVVLLTQNGDTFCAAANALGRDRVLSAFVNFSADYLGPGRVRMGGLGELVIGERHGAVTRRVREYVSDLRDFGQVRASADVAGFLWAKRGVAAIFAGASLADEPLSELIDDYREILSCLATEVYETAAAEGVSVRAFDGIAVTDLVQSVRLERRTAAFAQLVRFTRSQLGKPRSGIFRDIAIHRRPTEARPELRTLAELGAKHGIQTPTLQSLELILAGLEDGSRAFSRENYADLIEASRTGTTNTTKEKT